MQSTRDCLHLLEDGPTLGEEAKRTLALQFAMGSVMDETPKRRWERWWIR
ncbi:hypothetical protein [Pyxidicoccus trucidator]